MLAVTATYSLILKLGAIEGKRRPSHGSRDIDQHLSPTQTESLGEHPINYRPITRKVTNKQTNKQKQTNASPLVHKGPG